MVGNSLFRQKIGIPMGIDPAPFCTNLFIHIWKQIHVWTYFKWQRHAIFKQLSVYWYLGTLNDGGALNDVYIYPPILQLKVEHCGTHATFLNLDITGKDEVPMPLT